jgi:MoxR-like ATPase
MDIKKILKVAQLSNNAVLLRGKHGIGKSQQIKQYAKENNYHLEELFLSHQEIGDLIGIPTTKEINGELATVWTKPIWLERMYEANWPDVTIDELEFEDEEFKEFVIEYIQNKIKEVS